MWTKTIGYKQLLCGLLEDPRSIKLFRKTVSVFGNWKSSEHSCSFQGANDKLVLFDHCCKQRPNVSSFPSAPFGIVNLGRCLYFVFVYCQTSFIVKSQMTKQEHMFLIVLVLWSNSIFRFIISNNKQSSCVRKK